MLSMAKYRAHQPSELVSTAMRRSGSVTRPTVYAGWMSRLGYVEMKCPADVRRAARCRRDAQDQSAGD
jgi:hypothetical protein